MRHTLGTKKNSSFDNLFVTSSESRIGQPLKIKLHSESRASVLRKLSSFREDAGNLKMRVRQRVEREQTAGGGTNGCSSLANTMRRKVT